MSHSHTTTSSSSFESLPPEIMNMILGELLAPSKRPLPGAQYCPDQSVLDTAILRTNKGIHAITKSYLDLANKWVIFDMDHIHLFLPLLFTCAEVPMITIDPEAGYAIPEGIMRVRVKLHLSNVQHAVLVAGLCSASVPKRQLVLVQAGYLHAFLDQIRSVELTHGVRVMPGQEFESAGDVPTTAKRGFHGLNIRVVVNPEVPQHLMRPLLDGFRIFHGPLNEVTIIGSSETQHARKIEASIAAPRTADDLTFYERLIHVAKLIKASDDRASKTGNWLHTMVSYSQADYLLTYSGDFDRTPWNGSLVSSDWQQRPFEVLMVCITYLNTLIMDMQYDGETLLQTIDDVLSVHPPELTMLGRFHNLSSEMIGWTELLVGLKCIFSVRIVGYALDSWLQLDIVRDGITSVESTVGLFEHLPEADTVLFRHAIEMCVKLRDHDSSPDKTTLLQVINEYKGKFVNLITEQKRRIKWSVHQSLIPQALINRGILGYMTNNSRMTPEEKHRSLIVNAFVIEEEEGDCYCI